MYRGRKWTVGNEKKKMSIIELCSVHFVVFWGKTLSLTVPLSPSWIIDDIGEMSWRSDIFLVNISIWAPARLPLPWPNLLSVECSRVRGEVVEQEPIYWLCSQIFAEGWVTCVLASRKSSNIAGRLKLCTCTVPFFLASPSCVCMREACNTLQYIQHASFGDIVPSVCRQPIR